MNKKRHITAALLFLAFITQSGQAALFTIGKPTFCAHVNHDDFSLRKPSTNGRIKRSDLDEELLYFFVVIIGDEGTFTYLEQHSHLEVRAEIWAGGIWQDKVQFGITPDRWRITREKLRAELDSNGVFTFRTYMYTKKIWFSRIELVLKDGNNRVVREISKPRGYRGRIEVIQ